MSQQTQKSQPLERTLGLRPALAIGMGTMIGAGIFVFPGLAAEQAGTGAFLSFIIAGVIAAMVAMCAAELGTAMPKSGGVYFFAMQTLGRRGAFLVGISQWLGLIFAAAFYLVGFIKYSQRVLLQLGGSELNYSSILLVVTGATLVIINIVGAEWFGRVQNVIVGALILLLTGFMAIAFFRMTGLVEPHIPVREPFSKGVGSSVSTTALIFTAFLGFVQITTVGGEIRNPDRNLPRALLGSVVTVTIIYALTLFMATNVVSAERLAEEGETAMILVARQLLGGAGALVMLTAGLLATLSSANASVLSASRAIYALSDNQQAPKRLRRLSQRFGTPHNALVVTGVPILLLAAWGPVQLLAEVASCLHLVLYALIGGLVAWLRHRAPDWYQPGFRVLASPWLPMLAALCCVAVIALMEPQSLLIATSILGLSLVIGWPILGRQAKLS